MNKQKVRVAYATGGLTLYHGDSRDVLAAAPASYVDSIVTDPPYSFDSIVKRFGRATAAPAKGNPAYGRTSRGFMGHTWDTGEVAFSAEFWGQCFRVLKPGGYAVAFSASRNYHKLATAIEAAGFEIRDSIVWLYGTGFPKSHAQKGEWEGWGTALKPAHEPIVLARKPLAEKTVAANLEEHRVGALNIEDSRVGAEHNDAGRFPSNVLHDGSPAALDILGGASAYFYSAKASKADRFGSAHPTVKPVDLMAYLVRLVTPAGGLVLDPFAGSGTTAAACARVGMRCALIEREPEYVADIKRRLAHISDADSALFEALKDESKTEITEAVEC